MAAARTVTRFRVFLYSPRSTTPLSSRWRHAAPPCLPWLMPPRTHAAFFPFCRPFPPYLPPFIFFFPSAPVQSYDEQQSRAYTVAGIHLEACPIDLRAGLAPCSSDHRQLPRGKSPVRRDARLRLPASTYAYVTERLVRAGEYRKRPGTISAWHNARTSPSTWIITPAARGEKREPSSFRHHSGIQKRVIGYHKFYHIHSQISRLEGYSQDGSPTSGYFYSERLN